MKQPSMPSRRAGSRSSGVLTAKSCEWVCNGHHCLLRMEKSDVADWRWSPLPEGLRRLAQDLFAVEADIAQKMRLERQFT
jgi:hypothetical protein